MVPNAIEGPGTDFQGLLRTWWNSIYQDSQGSRDLIPFQNLSALWWWNSELSPFNATVDPGLVDYSPSGSPAAAIVANGTGGQQSYTLSSTNEAQLYGYGWGDNLYLRLNRPFYNQFRFKIPVAITTAQRAFLGVGTAVSAPDPEDLTRCAGILLNASMVANTMVDDNASVDSTTTGTETLVADTWYTAAVLMDETGVVRIYLGDDLGENCRQIGYYSPVFGANNGQAINAVGKSTGVTQPSIVIDSNWGFGTRV